MAQNNAYPRKQTYNGERERNTEGGSLSTNK
jgi:hypothetical protein